MNYACLPLIKKWFYKKKHKNKFFDLVYTRNVIPNHDIVLMSWERLISTSRSIKWHWVNSKAGTQLDKIKCIINTFTALKRNINSNISCRIFTLSFYWDNSIVLNFVIHHGKETFPKKTYKEQAIRRRAKVRMGVKREMFWNHFLNCSRTL